MNGFFSKRRGRGSLSTRQEELFAGIWGLLERPDILRTRGEAGRQAVAANKGAAERYAALIADVLK